MRVERDEARWPSRGTWPRYRGREGTVITVSHSAGEYGVTFGAVGRRPDGSLYGNALAWFRAHELVPAASGKPPAGPYSAPPGAAPSRGKGEGARTRRRAP